MAADSVGQYCHNKGLSRSLNGQFLTLQDHDERRLHRKSAVPSSAPIVSLFALWFTL